MSDSQFQSLGKLIAEKLNNIITKVNTHTSDKADLTGATFTGSITVGDITLPTTDGNQNQVLTTDGNGNLSFQDVSTTDTRVTGTTVSGTDLTINLSDGNSITQDITSLVASSFHLITAFGSGDVRTGSTPVKDFGNCIDLSVCKASSAIRYV